MMTLITINRVYYLIGFVVMLLVIMTLRDRANPKRFTTALFWFLFGGIFLMGDLMVQELGKSLAYRIIGGTVIVIALLAGFGLVGKGHYKMSDEEARVASSERLKNWLFLPALKEATSHLPVSDPRRQLVDKLVGWDGTNLLSEGGKTYQQPGSAILNAWLTSMLKRTVVAAVPKPFGDWYSASGYETTQDGPTGSLNISVGAKILYEALQGEKSPIPQAVDLFGGKPQHEVVLAALDDAWQTLSTRYGNDLNGWKTPAMALTFRANNFFGVPQAAADEARHQAEYQNRGTENDMIVFSPSASKSPVLAWDVVAPGQSGFIAPDGKADKHYDDQLKMYETFGRKSLWLTPQEVDEHKESQEVLQVKR